MNEPHYRLLNIGERALPTDEYHVAGQWMSLGNDFVSVSSIHSPIRRLIEQPKWISVKERAREHPCWSGWVSSGFVSLSHCSSDNATPTHWMPVFNGVPKPPKENEDERAFLEWLKTPLPQNSVHLTKAAWFAALEYARKK